MRNDSGDEARVSKWWVVSGISLTVLFLTPSTAPLGVDFHTMVAKLHPTMTVGGFSFWAMRFAPVATRHLN